MAHIALLGATGQVGSRILQELVNRGHTVTAIARRPERVPALSGVTAKAGDVKDIEALTQLLTGHDVVISAIKFLDSDTHTLIAAVQAAGVPRYLVVGGAGSLEVASGQRLVDLPAFPEEYKAEAIKGAEFLDLLRREQALDWSFLSPSAEFVPGERTGVFRIGGDQLLHSDEGSRISFEDYAMALVDEVERPAHSRQRFTVGY
ncbi:NAD(P)-dependent oxidoreductase [Alcaligenaceae bacterium 429]|uniref:NAD(P)-dependent oxidoreductase n=1 Tax=Paenalcaligenes sp. Me52 TaxID=3392038 RepID=UPI001092774D|nr:NAD(P)-dependent oxidoreductase [Alcaligenaceae bacterium 429]